MRADLSERHFRTGLLVLGHGVFIALLVLAWKYAILRTTYGDSAFQIFQWISQPGWDIEAHRYTAILPQAVVKFVALFAVDLRTLLYTASLAHALVAYAVFLLCAHVWKAPEAALGCALAAVLCSRFTFYSPVLETNYLLCFPFLLCGYVGRRNGTGPWSARHVLFAILLLLFPLIVHPMGWMVMLFCVAFFLATGRLPLKAFIPLVGLCVLWPLLTRVLFEPTGYELEQYASLEKGFSRLGSFFEWGSWRFLSLHTWSASTTYLPAWIVLVAVTLGWAWLRQWRAAVLALGGAVAFLLVFLITFHSGNSAVMQDRGILPVASIIALSTATLLMRLEVPRTRTLALIALAAVLFVKARDISFASRSFTKHFEAMEELIAAAEDQGLRRAIVPCDPLKERGVEITWAFPVESLLRSAVRGPEHARVLVCAEEPLYPQTLAQGKLEVLQIAWSLDIGGERYFPTVRSPYAPLR